MKKHGILYNAQEGKGRMEMIQAVIFDMDGVLIDSEPPNLQLIADFFALHGKHATQDYLNSLVGRSTKDTWANTLAAWGEAITPEAYQERFQAYREQHPLHYPSLLFDDVKELLEWLKQANYTLAVASSTRLDVVKQVLIDCGIIDYFSIVVSGADCTHSKPDPEIYLHAASVLGLDPSACVAIEDSTAGMLSARSAGMQVIAKIDERYGADPDLADTKVHHLIEIKDLLASKRIA